MKLRLGPHIDARLERRSSRQTGVALVYHRVGETVGDFDVAREEFERQMRHLRRCYRVVKAAEILEAAGNRRRGRRFPVAITLDDDLPSHVEEALPALQREGLSATFFLGGAWVIESTAGRFGPESVRALAEAGFDVGFHTLRHRSLPSLSDVALEQALHEGREELAAAAGRRLDLIGYPHGKADGRVADATRSARFALGFTTYWGLAVPEADPYLIPRIVPASSAGAFALQLARAFAGGSRAPTSPAPTP